MADDEMVQVSVARGVQAVTQRDGLPALIFRMHDGEPNIAIGFTPSILSDTVAALIETAVKLGAQAAQSPGPEVQAHPILVSHLAIMPGRNPAETILTLQVAHLTLTFLVATSRMAELTRDLSSRNEGMATEKDAIDTL